MNGDAHAREAGHDGESLTMRAAVRPYVMTKGRTEVDATRVKLETLVATNTAAAQAASTTLTYEHERVAGACNEPLSVAEIALRLSLPVGVVRVVVDDLANSGIVALSETEGSAHNDTAFLQRLIDGVRSL